MGDGIADQAWRCVASPSRLECRQLRREARLTEWEVELPEDDHLAKMERHWSSFDLATATTLVEPSWVSSACQPIRQVRSALGRPCRDQERQPQCCPGDLARPASSAKIPRQVLYSYRVRLDYRFEVTAIGVTWLVLIAAPALLSIALVRTRPVKDQRAAHLEMSSQSLPR
jgi:hypothetical protein